MEKLEVKSAKMAVAEKGPSTMQKRRVRKEARSVALSTRRALVRHGGKVAKEARGDIEVATSRLEGALSKGDHDEIVVELVKVDALVDEHLSFTKKSTFREYADSIVVAVLVALLLRAFVVEAFKIPSGSMIPTMEVGDHIFVNKFIYGLRLPFTKIKFFEWRKPRRGEVIVFIYPNDPDKDFIKRIVAVEGDVVEVKKSTVYINGKPIPQHQIAGLWTYQDFDELRGSWEEKVGRRIEEEVEGKHYITLHDPDEERGSSCTYGCFEPYTVPKGKVFVLGDNRNNSHDSRYWGPVPLENIKGKALVVWWSQSGDGVRWGRLGHLVE